MSLHRSIASPIAEGLASTLLGGVSGLLDFLPPTLLAGGMAVGTSRLFSAYDGPLARLGRSTDSEELDVGGRWITSSELSRFAGKNLLESSGNMSSRIAWRKTNATVTGTLFTRDSAASAWVTQSVNKAPIPLVITVSCLAKKVAGDYAALRLQGVYPSRVDATFDLGAGAVTSAATASGDFSAANASISDAGDGWYKLTISCVTDHSDSVTTYVSANSNGGGVDVVDTAPDSSADFKDLQLEYGNSATGYELSATSRTPICFVRALYDQLGAHDVVPQTIGDPPTIIPRQIGELPIIVADGASKYFETNANFEELAADDRTLIAVGQGYGETSQDLVSIGPAQLLELSSIGAATYWRGTTGDDIITPVPVSTRAAILHDYSTSRARPSMVRVNGTDHSVDTTGVEDTPSSRIRIFGRSDDQRWWRGSLNAAIALRSILPEAQKVAVEAKLMSEYAIQP